MPGSIIILTQLIISILSENTLNYGQFVFIPGILAVLVNKYYKYENSNIRTRCIQITMVDLSSLLKIYHFLL